MNTIKIQILSIVTGLLLLVNACTPKADKAQDNTQTETQQAIPVKTSIIQKESITRNIEFTVNLAPFEEVHLAPSTPGRIEKINVEIGDPVTKGQILAIMDRSNLEQSRINLMKLKADFNRLDTLIKTKSIAEQQYDQVKSAYQIAENSYQFLLENTQLKAPFSGFVSGKYFENGEIYSGAPIATIGKPAILSIVQIRQLKAMVGISASYYPLITKGMTADVTSEIYPNRTFKGEISRIYPTVDNTTKTFTVEIKIQNPQLKLRPGMFSKINLHLGKGEALLVPTIALIKQTGTNNMYVFVNKNNVAVKTPVEVGKIFDDKTEILQGIHEGDEIVTVGQNKLENQSLLNIIH